MPRSDDTPALPDEHSCEPRSWLCPNFTFANFVVGRCNRLAYDAARPIASSPSLHTAPLFLFGGNGTGKTHLLHAIGHEVAHHFRSVRAVCTTSEQFVNHFISCSRAERMERFRDFYGALDLLLVDHVQLLGNKVRTRGEFLKTVNTMLDARKRVVLASDATPREIPGFTKGLLSRFRQIGVGPPDIATKLAMLDSRRAVKASGSP